MVVMDEKGNEKNGTMHEEQSNPTKISVTEGSTRAVPNQHGPVLSPCRKSPSSGNWTRAVFSGHAPVSRLLFQFSNFCYWHLTTGPCPVNTGPCPGCQ